MLKFHRLILITLLINLIEFSSSANHNRQNEINMNFHNFEQMKIDLFTSNRETERQYKAVTRNDEECMIELDAIGNGVKNMEFWALKRKIKK